MLSFHVSVSTLAKGNPKHPKMARKTVIANSKFFENCPAKVSALNIGKFFAFVFHRFKYSDASESCISEKAGVHQRTTFRWRQNLFWLFKKVREEDVIQLGNTGSPIEFDGAYYAPKWNQAKNQRKPTNWKKNCLFRVIERFWTAKGRHKQVSYVTQSENEVECLEILRRHVPDKNTRIMLDGCGVGRSIKLRSEYPRIKQCNHKRGNYVKPSSLLEDFASKVHDNTAENSFLHFRRTIRKKFGFHAGKGAEKGDNKQKLWNYIYETDWINNYTSNEVRDYMKTFVEHISEFCV